MKIRRSKKNGGKLVKAVYVCHRRTLTPNNSLGGRSYDIDVFRLTDGTEIECRSLENDGRDTPREIDPEQGYGVAAT